jgi:tetratricopeptide (TPR) repeat protein
MTPRTRKPARKQPDALLRAGSRISTVMAIVLLLHMALTASALAEAPVSAHSGCLGSSPSASISDARSALDRTPGELAPRLKLADALVDQGCYDDAVSVLQAGEKLHPHSAELLGKLRDVRSMLTEQTYIQDLTQAEDAAKLQHNRLRCTRLADLDACDEGLKAVPNDAALWAAKGDALMQRGLLDEAIASYGRALQGNAADESLKSKLAVALARRDAESMAATNGSTAKTPEHAPLATETLSSGPNPRAAGVTAPTAGALRGATANPARPTRSAAIAAPVASVAQVAGAPRYSNEALPGRSN